MIVVGRRHVSHNGFEMGSSEAKSVACPLSNTQQIECIALWTIQVDNHFGLVVLCNDCHDASP
jgi:hypothetical protein